MAWITVSYNLLYYMSIILYIHFYSQSETLFSQETLKCELEENRTVIKTQGHFYSMLPFNNAPIYNP